MADQAGQVSTNGLVDTKRRKQRQYSEALKRQMVAERQRRPAFAIGKDAHDMGAAPDRLVQSLQHVGRLEVLMCWRGSP